MRTNTFRTLAVAATLLLTSAGLQAHIVPGDPTGFHHGFSHPFTGLDHFLAMLGVGLWAAQQRGRATWLIPLSFVGVMTLGALVGMTGFALPSVDLLIAASVLVIGLLIASVAQLPRMAAMMLAGSFAFFHGFAHGHEMPASAGALEYTVGFIGATLALHALGFFAAWSLQKMQRPLLVRWVGGAICASSVWLFLA